MCVIGPWDVDVALVALLATPLLETVGGVVEEGASVTESVGLGVDESVAGAVESCAKPTAARPRKRTSD